MEMEYGGTTVSRDLQRTNKMTHPRRVAIKLLVGYAVVSIGILVVAIIWR